MRPKPTLDEYLNDSLEIKDGVLTSNLIDISVMNDQERLIMEESAKIICKNGGDILNVGFGLGIIDSYIQQHAIDSHTIIEIHPDVIKYARELGFDKNARICKGDWRSWVTKFNEEGIKFDGIYFDTINIIEDANEWADFIKDVDTILKPGGIFSYFNNFATKNPEFQSMSNMLTYTYKNKLIKLEDIEAVAGKEIDKTTLPYKDYQLVWRIKE